MDIISLCLFFLNTATVSSLDQPAHGCGREKLQSQGLKCDPKKQNDEATPCSSQAIQKMCSTWCKPLTLDIQSKEWGIVDFIIKQPPDCCLFNKVSIQVIHVQPNADGTSIEKIQKRMDVLLESSPSNETSLMRLRSKYIFSGIYYLKIRPFFKCHNSRMPCTTDHVNITTQYIPKYISGTKLILNNRYDGKSRQLILFAQGDGIGEGDFIYLFFSKAQWTCTSDTYYALLYLKCSEINETIGRFGDNGKGYLDHMGEEKRCTLKANELSCTFSNVSSGYYYFSIEVIDQRCKPGTMWVVGGNTCRWYQSQMLNSPSGIVKVAEEKAPIWLWPVLGVFGLLLFAFIFLILKWRMSGKAPSTINILDKGQFKPIPPQVLLLYSREDPLFMNAMSHLRNYLSDSLGKKVFDVWDPDEFEAVATLAEGWVLNLLHKKGIELVIVLSPSSLLIEKLLLRGEVITYRHYHFLNSLFPFALTQIMRKPTLQQTHWNIKVISFDKGSNSPSFQTLSTSPIYKIPEMLDSLTLSLYGLGEGATLLHQPSKEKLLESLELLKDLSQPPTQLLNLKDTSPRC